ncbi:MAG: PaaI family thioesterase [Deferribacterota bacterium]|nr:PaaI family thioesterase [Deferribacterota bacterium]
MNYNNVNDNSKQLIEIANKILSKEPFSIFLEAKILDFQIGSVILEIPISENYLQQNGFVHGGVLSYAADNALSFAGGSVLGTNVLTLEFKINYLRPAIGKSLLAYGNAIYSSKRQAACRSDIYVVNKEDDKKLCAIAQGTIITIDNQNNSKMS